MRVDEITLDLYFSDPQTGKDRRREYPDALTAEIVQNASRTVVTARQFAELLPFEVRASLGHASGWRPPAVNAATLGAKTRSRHLLALAWDWRETPERLLRSYLFRHVDSTEAVLSEHGLVIQRKLGIYFEHPNATASKRGYPWVHWQTVPPRSGRAVFWP